MSCSNYYPDHLGNPCHRCGMTRSEVQKQTRQRLLKQRRDFERRSAAAKKAAETRRANGTNVAWNKGMKGDDAKTKYARPADLAKTRKDIAKTQKKDAKKPTAPPKHKPPKRKPTKRKGKGKQPVKSKGCAFVVLAIPAAFSVWRAIDGIAALLG